MVQTAERDAQLPAEEGAIGGLVQDDADGKALAMVIVQAESDGKIVASDVSDYKGNYRVGPLPPGNYRVSARFANARMVYESVVVQKANQTEVNVAMDLRVQDDPSTAVQIEGTLGAIEGVVVDGMDGSIFPGTVVALHAPHLSDAVMAIADKEGRFRFRSLKPGTYSLSCYYQLVDEGSIELRHSNIMVERGERTNVEVKLDLRIR